MLLVREGIAHVFGQIVGIIVRAERIEKDTACEIDHAGASLTVAMRMTDDAESLMAESS